MTSEKFLAPTPPAERQKCVSRERKLGSENAFQIFIADNVSIPNMTLEKFLPQPPSRQPKMCISKTEARIGKRISNVDSWWRQHSKYDIRKISRPIPPGQVPKKRVSQERDLGSENGLQI